MKFVVLAFQFLSCLCVLVPAGVLDVSPGADTVVLLHVLFRHGNRAPDKDSLFPTDPNLNKTFAPFGYGQLTNKGKKTEFEIGQYLRSTYGYLIPEQYTPDVAYAISTNFKRTKMSLELVLAGLFPPLPTDIFVDGLNWQPISFNVEQDEHYIGVPSIYCPNYIRLFYRYILSEEGQAILDNYKDLYQQVSKDSGVDLVTPDALFDVYETLQCEEDFGLELPEWASEIYPGVLDEASSVYLQFATATPALRRLTTGHFLQKILDDSLSKRDGTLPEERKIFLYSAHDYNVGTVLRSLGIDYRHVPPYGATIFFEIHNVDGVYGLKLFYQDYSATNPQLLILPGCSSFCELETFAELIADNLPGPEDVCSSSAEIM